MPSARVIQWGHGSRGLTQPQDGQDSSVRTYVRRCVRAYVRAVVLLSALLASILHSCLPPSLPACLSVQQRASGRTYVPVVPAWFVQNARPTAPSLAPSHRAPRLRGTRGTRGTPRYAGEDWRVRVRTMFCNSVWQFCLPGYCAVIARQIRSPGSSAVLQYDSWLEAGGWRLSRIARAGSRAETLAETAGRHPGTGAMPQRATGCARLLSQAKRERRPTSHSQDPGRKTRAARMHAREQATSHERSVV